jgi:muconate cycloisomerase
MTDMKIVAVEPYIVEVPLRQPARGVHGVTAVQRSVLVRVAAGDGVDGWGDVDPTPGYSLVSAEDIYETVTRLAPVLAGLDPFNIRRVLSVMDERVAGGREAKAAVEMALCDLKGRALSVPLHSLLGGRVKHAITLNAWIGTVPPAQAAAEAQQWLALGFASAKIKLEGPDPEGLDRVAAVRDAVGEGLALRVDFNESLPLADAVSFIRKLEPFGLTLVEQPVPREQIAALAEIRRGIGIPLMADESVSGPPSLVEIIRREAADLVKVKVMKQGGLTRTLALVETAAAAGLGVVVGHGFGLTLSTLAEATVAAVSPAVLDGCEAVGPLKMAGDVVTAPAVLDHGVITLPDTPGLGAEVDREALARYQRRGPPTGRSA